MNKIQSGGNSFPSAPLSIMIKHPPIFTYLSSSHPFITEIARKLATAKIYVVRSAGPPLNRWIIAIAGHLGCQVCDIDVTESITVISDRIDVVMSSFYGRKNNGDDGTSRGR